MPERSSLRRHFGSRGRLALMLLALGVRLDAQTGLTPAGSSSSEASTPTTSAT